MARSRRSSGSKTSRLSKNYNFRSLNNKNNSDAEVFSSDDDNIPNRIKKVNNTNSPASTISINKRKRRHSNKNDEESVNKKPNTENLDSVFYVERILNDKLENGQRFFFLKWEGYGDEENTWEPQENVNSQDLIDEYFAQKESINQQKAISESSEHIIIDSDSNSIKSSSRLGNSLFDRLSTTFKTNNKSRETSPSLNGSSIITRSNDSNSKIITRLRKRTSLNEESINFLSNRRIVNQTSNSVKDTLDVLRITRSKSSIEKNSKKLARRSLRVNKKYSSPTKIYLECSESSESPGNSKSQNSPASSIIMVNGNVSVHDNGVDNIGIYITEKPSANLENNSLENANLTNKSKDNVEILDDNENPVENIKAIEKEDKEEENLIQDTILVKNTNNEAENLSENVVEEKNGDELTKNGDKEDDKLEANNGIELEQDDKEDELDAEKEIELEENDKGDKLEEDNRNEESVDNGGDEYRPEENEECRTMDDSLINNSDKSLDNKSKRGRKRKKKLQRTKSDVSLNTNNNLYFPDNLETEKEIELEEDNKDEESVDNDADECRPEENEDKTRDLSLINNSDNRLDNDVSNKSARFRNKSKRGRKRKKKLQRTNSDGSLNTNHNVYFPHNLEQNVQEIFQVEKILKMKMVGCKRHFLLKWEGFPHSEDTWEPEDNMECPDLIEDFLESQKHLVEATPSMKDDDSIAVEDEFDDSEEKSVIVHKKAVTRPYRKLKKRHKPSKGYSSPTELPEEDAIMEQSSHNKPKGKLRIAERILAAGVVDGTLQFLIKWKNKDLAHLVKAERAYAECPQVCLKYFHDKIMWRDSSSGEVTEEFMEKLTFQEQNHPEEPKNHSKPAKSKPLPAELVSTGSTSIEHIVSEAKSNSKLHRPPASSSSGSISNQVKSILDELMNDIPPPKPRIPLSNPSIRGRPRLITPRIPNIAVRPRPAIPTQTASRNMLNIIRNFHHTNSAIRTPRNPIQSSPSTFIMPNQTSMQKFALPFTINNNNSDTSQSFKSLYNSNSNTPFSQNSLVNTISSPSQYAPKSLDNLPSQYAPKSLDDNPPSQYAPKSLDDNPQSQYAPKSLDDNPQSQYVPKSKENPQQTSYFPKNLPSPPRPPVRSPSPPPLIFEAPKNIRPPPLQSINEYRASTSAISQTPLSITQNTIIPSTKSQISNILLNNIHLKTGLFRTITPSPSSTTTHINNIQPQLAYNINNPQQFGSFLSPHFSHQSATNSNQSTTPHSIATPLIIQNYPQHQQCYTPTHFNFNNATNNSTANSPAQTNNISTPNTQYILYNNNINNTNNQVQWIMQQTQPTIVHSSPQIQRLSSPQTQLLPPLQHHSHAYNIQSPSNQVNNSCTSPPSLYAPPQNNYDVYIQNQQQASILRNNQHNSQYIQYNNSNNSNTPNYR